MKKRLFLSLLISVFLVSSSFVCVYGKPSYDEICEIVKPYIYTCDSLDGNYIIAEEIRYAFANVDSAYSVYIVFDQNGNVVIPLGEKTWEELGWEGYVRPSTFRDVSAEYGQNPHWASADILTLAAYGVINGYPGGYFYPDQGITRAEFLKLISKIVQDKYVIPDELSTNFQDVDDTDWYAGYIDWAYNHKIITGYPDGMFYPNKEITREEMACIAYRAIDALDLSFPRAEKIDAVNFADSSETAKWAQAAVSDLSEYQFLKGNDDHCFLPQKKASRAEAVTLTARMYYDMFEPDDRWL